MLIKVRSPSHPLPSEITPPAIYKQRRRFVQGGAAVLGGGLLSPAAHSLSLDLSELPDSRFNADEEPTKYESCLLYTSPSPRDRQKSRMPSSA